MLAVTRDMVLPTTITGSYPRPAFGLTAAWPDHHLNRRYSLFREQYLVAVASSIAEQETVALNIVTDSDRRFDQAAPTSLDRSPPS